MAEPAALQQDSNVVHEDEAIPVPEQDGDDEKSLATPAAAIMTPLEAVSTAEQRYPVTRYQGPHLFETICAYQGTLCTDNERCRYVHTHVPCQIYGEKGYCTTKDCGYDHVPFNECRVCKTKCIPIYCDSCKADHHRKLKEAPATTCQGCSKPASPGWSYCEACYKKHRAATRPNEQSSRGGRGGRGAARGGQRGGRGGGRGRGGRGDGDVTIFDNDDEDDGGGSWRKAGSRNRKQF